MSKPNFDIFLEELKAAPQFVKDNVMCYFYHNTSACDKCPDMECKAREPLEIVPSFDKIKADLHQPLCYTVRIDEYRTIKVPNPKNHYMLFCDVIRKIASGKYKMGE